MIIPWAKPLATFLMAFLNSNFSQGRLRHLARRILDGSRVEGSARTRIGQAREHDVLQLLAVVWLKHQPPSAQPRPATVDEHLTSKLQLRQS